MNIVFSFNGLSRLLNIVDGCFAGHQSGQEMLEEINACALKNSRLVIAIDGMCVRKCAISHQSISLTVTFVSSSIVRHHLSPTEVLPLPARFLPALVQRSMCVVVVAEHRQVQYSTSVYVLDHTCDVTRPRSTGRRPRVIYEKGSPIDRCQ